MGLKFRYSAVSDIGSVRKNNEDNLFAPGEKIREPKKNVYTYSGTHSAGKAFFCVFDGMGGHNAGEVASFIAAQQVSRNYNKILAGIKSASGVRKTMYDFVSGLNDTIYGATEGKDELQSMGTTMTGIFFIGDGAHFVNIGDSRVYMLKNNKMTQITQDHADSENQHALTRFLGMSSEYGEVLPDVAEKKVSIGMKTRFLLCSDGLTDMVDDTLIRNTLIEKKNPDEAVKELVDLAKKNGGKDNITVLVIDAEPSNKVGAVLKNKIVIACILAALAIGGGICYYQMTKPAPVGISFMDLTADIQNAKDWSEASEKMEEQLKGLEANYTEYKGFVDTVDESDEAVKAKNAELRTLVEQFRANIDSMTEKYNTLKNDSEMTDEQKKNSVAEIVSDTSAVETFEACKNKRSEVEAAIKEWHEREEAKRKAEEAATPIPTQKPQPRPTRNPQPQPTQRPQPQPTQRPQPTKRPQPQPTQRPQPQQTQQPERPSETTDIF